MITNKVHVQSTVADKVYQFVCDQHATFVDIKEALAHMMKVMTEIEEGAKKAAAEYQAACQSEAPVSPPTEEPPAEATPPQE